MRQILLWATMALISSTVATTVSRNARCGPQFGLTCWGSTFGNCCSQHSYCGWKDDYCGAGCQKGWGACNLYTDPRPNTKPTSSSAAATPTLVVSTNARCGTGFGFTCQGSIYGNCCSQYSYCGRTDAYCGVGCQKGFGTCDMQPSSSSSMSSSTSASSSISIVSSSSASSASSVTSSSSSAASSSSTISSSSTVSSLSITSSPSTTSSSFSTNSLSSTTSTSTSSSASAALPTNLVQNSGFENGQSPWNLEQSFYPTEYNDEISDSVGADGSSHSAHFFARSYYTMAPFYITQTVVVPAARAYTFSYEYYVSQSSSGNTPANCYVTTYLGDDTLEFRRDASAVTPGFVPFVLAITVAAAGSPSLEIDVSCGGTYDFYLDNVSLVQD